MLRLVVTKNLKNLEKKEKANVVVREGQPKNRWQWGNPCRLTWVFVVVVRLWMCLWRISVAFPSFTSKIILILSRLWRVERRRGVKMGHCNPRLFDVQFCQVDILLLSTSLQHCRYWFKKSKGKSNMNHETPSLLISMVLKMLPQLAIYLPQHLPLKGLSGQMKQGSRVISIDRF
jgi:hypothetical protein